MFVRLEKINPDLRQRRYYVMQIARTLFGEWCVIRHWGRIGTAGGQQMTDYVDTFEDAVLNLNALRKQKRKRGYLEVIDEEYASVRGG